ncbi:hypothetical protein N7638_17890 [Achromobacter mucicolens]|nr:hypothetical protein [Achromobacter mucicolens]MDG9969916.1 hypothetical protein [Achromobacter mucicolens]
MNQKQKSQPMKVGFLLAARRTRLASRKTCCELAIVFWGASKA